MARQGADAAPGSAQAAAAGHGTDRGGAGHWEGMVGRWWNQRSKNVEE